MLSRFSHDGLFTIELFVANIASIFVNLAFFLVYYFLPLAFLIAERLRSRRN